MIARILCAISIVVLAGTGTNRLSAADSSSDSSLQLVALSSMTLQGPSAQHQVLVNARTAKGRLVDVTTRSQFGIANSEVATVDSAGLLTAHSDGETELSVRFGDAVLTANVTVLHTGRMRRFNFERDIIPILSRYGCNASGCHGKAEGQNGFKLSVFGFDPGADYASLLHESRGRRINIPQPSASLLLTKASGSVPHGGGVRISQGSVEYRLMVDWIRSGASYGSDDDPQVDSIAVVPRERQLATGEQQQLRVIATYSDGVRRDVTSLTQFQSNRPGLASVDDRGRVLIGRVPGEVAIMASFMGRVDVFRGMIPRMEFVPQDLNAPPQQNFIDRLVDSRLNKLGIVASQTCSDSDYLRRVTLDVLGRLPTVEESRRFLRDDSAGKRTAWVNELLNKPQFADFWALRWSDLLRVDRSALGPRGAYDYYRWIRESISSNRPLDEFARDLILAEGHLYERPSAHFYRVLKDPGERAATVSQVFLGIRIECAQCHHHPFDRWSQADYVGMKSYFTQLAFKSTPRGDLLVANPGAAELRHPRTNAEIPAYPLGQPMPARSVEGDRRIELAEWLVSADNPWFARNMVNRFWAYLMGHGIVEPVDDVRMTNPASNPELLDELAADLIKHRFDAKHLIRQIVASRTYQLSVTPNATNELDQQNFSRALIRPLPAEVLLDAVCDVTGIPEKFDGLPSGLRAVQLWDSHVPHEFLQKFGRPVRATACECERSVEPSISQALHVMNSPVIQGKLSHAGGRVRHWSRELEDPRELIETVYLACYSRFPESEEREAVLHHLGKHAANREQAVEDFVWSLMNTSEFLFNH